MNGNGYVDNYNTWEVEDFNFDPDGFDPDGFDPDGFDSLFGLGKNRQQKKAEKKIEKAAIKLEKGNTKAANRKLAKGTAILNKISASQQATSEAQQRVSDIRGAQQQLQQNQIAMNEPVALNTQPMSAAGSSAGVSGGGAMSETASNVGADSAAPTTASNPDEPTGWLADEKELQGVTVISKGKNKNMALILIGVVLLAIAIIYFAPKFLKKK